MKKLVIVVGIAAALTGCSTTLSKKEQEKVVTLKEKQESLIPIGQTSYPNWYTVDTKSPNAIVVNATDRSRDMQFAIDKAMLGAKRDIALQIGSHVDVMMRDFVKESGADAGGDFARDIDRTTKIVVRQVNLMGYKREKLELIREGEYYRAFVRVQFPLDETNRLMVGAIKADRVSQAKVERSQAFRDLEVEVSKRQPIDLKELPAETFSTR